MTAQPVEDSEVGPTWDRLEDQLGWYDRKSMAAQQAYKRVKLSQLIVGAIVPVVAEGAQQLYQWQTNWVLYRATAEALKHEKYLYLAAAGPYRSDDRQRVLAERLEGLVSQEHAKWTESRQKDSHTSSAEPKRS
jgi:hypothetical protein